MQQQAAAASSNSSYNSPCAACKFLRRKCMPGCIFAPYFPPEEPQKFANVHKIFGASNVTKLLSDLLPHQREDAVNSLAYEAEARVRDPVYGCVGAISFLQRQVDRLQKELDAANADLIRFAYSDQMAPPVVLQPSTPHAVVPRQVRNMNMITGSSTDHQSDDQSGGGYYNNNNNQTPIPFPYSLPWNYQNYNYNPRGGSGGI